MKRTLFILIAVLISAGHLKAQPVNFIQGKWDDAKVKALSENKYLFIDCFTEWCGWCKTLDKNTFSNPKVGEVMNKNFVAVKIDMEKDYGINLSMKYRVNAFPTALIFDYKGNLVYRILGYADPDKYLNYLAEAMNPEKQYKLKGVSDKIDLDFPQFYRDAFAGNGKRKWPEQKVVTDYLDQRKDLFDEVSWAVIKICGGGEKYDQQVLNNIAKYKELYGPEVDEKTGNILYSQLSAAIKSKDVKKFNACLDNVNKYAGDDKAEMLQSFSLSYYSGIGDWTSFAKVFQEYLDKKGYKEAGTVNSYCWNIYEKCDDQAVISKACQWMKKAVEVDSQYAYLDTYASILYKNKQLKEAEIQAKKAIEAGKKSGDDVKSTEELLVKIQAVPGK
jgi:thioredoxin-related protein